MKTIKLPTKLIDRGDLAGLLRYAGLVNEESHTASPSALVVSKEDYKKLERGVTEQFRRENKFLRGNRLKTAVGMHMLNLAPVESVAVRPGFGIVLEETK